MSTIVQYFTRDLIIIKFKIKKQSDTDFFQIVFFGSGDDVGAVMMSFHRRV